MASLSSAKTLGGIGGILVFLPGLSLVGWVLILVSLNEISVVVHDRSIFDDALIAGITAILGAVAFFVFLVSGAFSTLFTFGALAFGTRGVLAAVGPSRSSGYSQMFQRYFSNEHMRKLHSD